MRQDGEDGFASGTLNPSDRETTEADAEVPEISEALFQTEDLQNAVRSFLERGPGHATFAGR